MHYPDSPARGLRHPKGHSPTVNTAPLLASEWRPQVLSIGLPRRVIGGCCDHAHRVPVIGKPCRHFARVFSNARRLGRKIRAVNQYPHVLNLQGSAARASRYDNLSTVARNMPRKVDLTSCSRPRPYYCLGTEMRNGSEMKTRQPAAAPP